MSTLALCIIGLVAVNALIVIVLSARPRRELTVTRFRAPIPTAKPDQPTLPLPTPDLLARR
jgi:hypothetical protein